MIKSILKKIVSTMIPVEYFERASVYSMYKDKFSESLKVPTLEDRFKLYDFAIDEYLQSLSSMTYIEFGVWKGESLHYFTKKNENKIIVYLLV